MLKLPLRTVAFVLFLFATLAFTGTVPAIASLVQEEGCGSCCMPAQAPVIPAEKAPCTEADCPCVYCLTLDLPVGFTLLPQSQEDPDRASVLASIFLRDIVFTIDYPPEIA